jgi:osmotically-inducible protein OsmY
MKKDIEIQANVIEELKSLPSINASEIGVAVKNGIVNLSGTVDSYPKKIAIERAVIKIKNVKGIAEDMIVRLNGSSNKTDAEIAQAVLYALEWHSGLEPEKIKIFVEKGVVSIEGNVEWDYKRKLASKAITNIIGVTGIINNMKISGRPLASEIKEKIHASFARNANVDADRIKVEVLGKKVILSGNVSNWAERKEAEQSVWVLPGVSEIDNRLMCEEVIEVPETI